MGNRFIIITPCYNVAKWLPINIQMTKFQSYKNFLCVLVDDKSTDNTATVVQQQIGDDVRFLYLLNENNGSQAKAYMSAIKYLEANNLIANEDILVEIDGDDWLSSVYVLDYLNQIYQQNNNILMTYGQYQLYPTANLGGHYSMHLCDTTQCRHQPFAYSHLKTYKYSLLNQLNRNDLIDPETGDYFSAAWDHVLCMPMVEMAGNDKIYRCDDVLYILNRSDDLSNEGKSRVDHQKAVERRVRNKKPYSKLI